MHALLSRIRISRKLGLLTALGVLAVICVIVLNLFAEQKKLMTEKETATRNLVHTAVSLVAHHHARAERGEISQEQAKQAAMDEIRALRFGNKDYFWINDMQPRMLMHPFKPEMDGTDVSGFTDPNGVQLFVEAVRTVKASGAGVIHYAWPKPGADAPVEKVSYVEGFAPWGWVVGSGIYVDDVRAAFYTSLRTSAIELLVVLALLLGASWLISRSITRPIQRALGVAEDMAQGRLDGELAVQGSDETAQLLHSFARTREALRRIADAQGEMGRQHEAGEIDYRIPANDFPGAYGAMAEGINTLVASHIAVKMRVVHIVGEYARGDLREDIERYPGKKAQVTAAVDAVKAGMQAVNGELKALVDAAVAGDFSQRGDARRYEFAYRDMIESLNALMASADRGIGGVGEVLTAVAEGDLTRRADDQLPGRFGQLATDCNRTVEHLTDIVGQIRGGSDAINVASGEIAAGNQDLSQRTEQQAASLEETASSMEELTSTVRQTADNARQANQLAIGAAQVAEQGGAVVGQVVNTMSAINESSRRISDIIGVIDGIAFQTNILALNAAVEAARAGEQGRGFAVVAAEVRSLAQRSAGAAKEIKTLITDSADKVRHGNALVDQAGRTMDEIVSSVKRVTDIIADISAASQEQSAGIEQVNQAITQMDEGTQQNAALVEEATAAARSMEQQAGQLVQTVAVFRVAHGQAVHAARAPVATAVAAPSSVVALGKRSTAPAPRAKAAPRARAPSATVAVAEAAGEWQEF